jgi:hypothetical protein
MKYGEVKRFLNQHGFTLEGRQTSSELEMLSFWHPTIEKEIFVDFVHDVDIPQDILDGREFSYDDENEEWLMNNKVMMINFDIDISMSFMSEGTLDTCGDRYENKIILFNEDVELTPKVLSIITDPYGFIKFQREHSEEMNKFFSWVETFIPTLEKYNLRPEAISLSGNEITLYRKIGIRFLKNKSRFIDFYFDILTWRKSITIKIQPGLLEDSAYLNGDCTIEEFKSELEKQWKVLEKFEELYENYN